MHRVKHPYEYNEHNAAKKTCKAAELSIVAVGFFRVCTLLVKSLVRYVQCVDVLNYLARVFIKDPKKMMSQACEHVHVNYHRPLHCT